MANVTVPRYGETNHFAIREGKLQDWYAAIFQEKLGADGSYETLDFGGANKYCYTLTLCQGDYDYFKDNAALKRYKIVVVIMESATNNITWDDADVFTVEDYENSYHYDYAVCSEPWACGADSLTSFGRVALRGTGAGGYASHALTYVGKVDKAWFRAYWNAIMVDDTIALTTAAPFEPGCNIFRVYTGSFAEMLNPVSYSKNGGWCEVIPSASNCDTGVSCSTLYCPGATWAQIEPYTPITGPSASYRFTIKHDGVSIGTYPLTGSEPITFYDANSYP